VHRRTRRTIAAAALAAGTIALGACSSSGETASDAVGSASSSTVASATDGTVATTPGTPVERRTRSTGCDTGSTPAAGVDEEITIDAGGTARTYLRHVPPAHDGSTALPIVVDLHGYQEGAKIHTIMSAMGPYGDTQGFITVTPQGEGEVPRWIAESGSDDVAFIGDVLDDVESTLCVDRDRIFVTGLSNGAFMTSTVACDLADRFAAAAPVAGIQDIEGCSPSRPVPVIAFHGTADTFVAYDGGLGASAMNLPAPDGSGRTLGDVIAEAEAAGPGAGTVPDVGGPPVPTIAAAWAARNGCESTPTETPVTDDVTEISFACPAGADVQLYRVTGGGHTWPGSAFSQSIANVVGPTTTSISANELMWAFFQAHPLPAS
jgi:polyhydroxybutyrate depolymerase